VGDLDGDGRPEIVIVNMNDKPSLLKNTAPRRNHAVAISLTGTRSNRSAIGARCTITAAGRRQTAAVVSGGSYFSQNSLTLYFGLASADHVDGIEIRWPNGETQSWPAQPADRTLLLTEGSSLVGQASWPVHRP
jgi:hypothetical protein